MDAATRAAEREARSGAPDACLRLHALLTRQGRPDDAYEALLPAISEGAVRKLLAEHPAWTHQGGGAGSAHWLDVAPLVEAPRRLWVNRELPYLSYGLIASPLGVVTCVHVDGDETRVVDGETGRLRHTWPSPSGRSWLSGEHLLCVGHPSRDLFTGEEVAAQTPEPAQYEAGSHLWSTASKKAPGAKAVTVTQVHHRKTKKLACEVPGVALLADAKAFTVDCGMGRKRGFDLFDLKGKSLWRIAGDATALTPTHVVVEHIDRPRGGQTTSRLEVVDRKKGKSVADLGPHALAKAPAVARDVVVFPRTETKVAAHRLTGELLWEHDLADELEVIEELAVLPRRVLVFGRKSPDTGVLVALAGAPPA
jgi:hypothetical protein